MLNSIVEIALTVFVTLMLIAQLIALRFRIPYTVALVLIGICITALSTAVLSNGSVSGTFFVSIQWIESLYNQLVDSGLFVGLIVPPLIFEAMMHIRRDELSAVIRQSLALATIGVLLSTAVATVLLWKLAGIPLVEALIFAAIISPTDTITVLQIFKRIKAPPRLSTMMDMEAAFNDATAIVLFSIILSSIGFTHSTVLLTGAATFIYSFLGGGVIGILVAYTARYIHTRVDDKLAEITLTIAAVYGSYVMATGIGTSGLIAVAIVGLYFGNSTMKTAVSKRVKGAILSFWEIAAFVGNTVAFLFIGFVVNLTLFFTAGTLVLIAFAATIIARAATVYPIFAAFNYAGRKEIPLRWGNIATLGGVRGALSIALLATLAASGVVAATHVSTIATMVLGVVFISIMIQVPILSRYATKLFGMRHRVRD